jgi:Leucine rich repeat
LAEYLLPMVEAFSRFMPNVTDVASRTMLYSQIDTFRAGVVEGDLVVSKGGLVYTNELVPAFERTRLGALFVTGSLVAPNATIAEPDIDWSPFLKIKGNVVAGNLCLGGSASEIDGDVTVSGVLMGYYNHGEMHIHGRTRAHLVLVDDYHFIFDGPVERKYVASGAAEISIPVDYERDRLHLILVPEVIDETNFVHDGVILDRLKRGLPILRPENEIGTPPPPHLSDKGAARLAELRTRKARGEDIALVNFEKCELRSIPDELQEFSAARELVLSNNRVKTLPAWIGKFENLEVLELEDCGLATIPREIAQLPRLRRLDLNDNPITALPFGADSFRSVEILSIGQNYQPQSTDFVAKLDLAQFPWLRVVEQSYDINTVDELVYHESDELWSNPHLEILDIGWPALKYGIPAGLLRARNLRALATRVNAAQLGSAIWRLPIFQHLEYLSTGYNDLSRVQLARLYEGLPRAFISTERVDGKDDSEFPQSERLWKIDGDVTHRRFTEAIAALDEMVAPINLRRPFLPSKLHAMLMTLCVRARRSAAEEEQDRGRRSAMAESALGWADRVLSVLPQNPESCWYLDHNQSWLVRLECLYARATGLSLRETPDAAAAKAALDTAQSELDRFPINPEWHSTESAIVRELRARIPA